jgi:hypothetical protein
MKWHKLGKIFCAENNTELMVTGGRAPVPIYLKHDLFRIYFSAYDSFGRGRIFSLEMDLKSQHQISNIIKQPHIDIGMTGCYDDNGIIPSCILSNNGEILIYTIGFSIKNKLLFDAASGLAVSNDGGNHFQKYLGPVIDRTVDDPCWAASPFVMLENGIYKMWYVSCIKWEKQNDGKLKQFYNIRYKESNNPVYWPTQSQVAIDFANDCEYAIARPCVIKDGPRDYKMWYSFRAQSNVLTYRIGFAVSKNGVDWLRRDNDAGIDVSAEGWDSEMICYPYIFDHKGKRYMLYNGNGYGRSGFGLAVLESE